MEWTNQGIHFEGKVHIVPLTQDSVEHRSNQPIENPGFNTIFYI